MGSASGTWEGAMHRQRTLVASAIVLALVACDGDSGAVDDGATTAVGTEQSTVGETTTATATTMPTQPHPDPEVLWDVYTSYFEAITMADWDTAKSLASGVAFEYVELREELHNISDQTGWVLITDRSDTGPGKVVVLEYGTVAVGVLSDIHNRAGNIWDCLIRMIQCSMSLAPSLCSRRGEQASARIGKTTSRSMSDF